MARKRPRTDAVATDVSCSPLQSKEGDTKAADDENGKRTTSRRDALLVMMEEQVIGKVLADAMVQAVLRVAKDGRVERDRAINTL